MTTIRTDSRSDSRGALALVAVTLALPGLAPAAHAAGDYGLLRLQLGTTNQFVLELSASEKYYQPFSVEGKGSCLVDWYSGMPYGQLSAAVGQAADGSRSWAKPGFGATSLGAWDGPKGTPCSRVSYAVDEVLRFQFGPDVEARTMRPDGTYANAYDRLELDVEVKADAAVMLVTKVAGVETGRFFLLTGASIDGSALPPNPDGSPQESSPEYPRVACRARSDSGPDSGPSDNCRWVIKEVVGTSFEMYPLAGEFSLEGGGDWLGTADYASRQSLIFLTYLEEGDLACGGHSSPLDIGTGASGASCQVWGPPATEAYCGTTFHYFFRDIFGANKGCELIKDSGAQVTASMQVTFPPEPRVSLEVLATTKATTVQFSDSYGATGSMQIGLCTGDVDGLGTDNPTIALVFDAGTGVWSVPGVTDSALPVPGKVQDAIPGNGFMDWACILEQTVEYQGTLASPTMQVTERVLFWGDFKMIRN